MDWIASLVFVGFNLCFAVGWLGGVLHVHWCVKLAGLLRSYEPAVYAELSCPPTSFGGIFEPGANRKSIERYIKDRRYEHSAHPEIRAVGRRSRVVGLTAQVSISLVFGTALLAIAFNLAHS